MRPADLRVEYARDPTGVDVERPRLGWTLDADRRGAVQTAYRIRVADSPEALEDAETARWDTGEVTSSRSSGVPYEGPPVEAGERVYWTVRVWDGDDEPSDWSDPGTWEAGPRPGDWTGEWLAAHETSDRERVRAHEWQWTDYTVAATLDGDGPAALLARVEDARNYYAARLDPDAGTLRLAARDHGRTRTLATGDLPDGAVDPDGTTTLAVTVAGDDLAATVDGTPVLEATDGAHDAGRVGVAAPGDDPVTVRDLTATDGEGRPVYADDFAAPEETAPNYGGGTVADGAWRVAGDEPALVHVFRPHVAPAPLFRRSVTVDQPVASARAYVSGLGFYELTVNGERVDDRVLGPERTNYEGVVPYATHDVTEALQAGENVVGVELGRARFGAVPPTVVNWHRAPWWSDPRLRLQIEVTLADGTTRTVATDGEWQVAEGPTRFDSLLVGEVHDARREREGWASPGGVESPGDWRPARVVEGPAGEPQSQVAAPMRVTETLTPASVAEPEPGTYVYDFGRQVVGRPELTVAGERGADVRLLAGERLTDDGTVYARTPFRDATIQSDTYVLAGDGEETWAPRFTYHGFRYVQVSGAGVPDDPEGLVTAAAFHTPVEDPVESDFACDSERFTAIHRRCRRALLNNLHSVPTDTPVYEKRGWTADALLTEELATYNFWMPRFDTKRLRDLRAEVRLDGEGYVPAVVPSANDADEDPNLDREPMLGWQSEYPLLVRWLHRYYGDERVLESHYDELVAFVDYVREAVGDDLLVETGLGDWVPPHVDGPHPPEGPAVVGTAYFHESVRALADVAAWTGREADAASYRSLADSIRAAFVDAFVDPETGTVATGEADEYRQTSNVLALAFDLVPETRREAVVERLVADVREEQGGRLNTGVFGTKHLLPVLSATGHHDLATTVAAGTDYPGWGYMVERGATALWESWGEDTRSRDHHFLGTVDQWFYQYVAGLRAPPDPGFETVRVAPLVNDASHDHALEWAGASVDTVRGRVASRWARTDAGLEVSVTVPAGATGRVELPTQGAAAVRVTEGGRPVWADGEAAPLPAGVESATRRGDRVALAVGSGDYEFALTRRT